MDLRRVARFSGSEVMAVDVSTLSPVVTRRALATPPAAVSPPAQGRGLSTPSSSLRPPAKAQTSPITPAAPSRFRPDIEGLRGFGFLLLVLTHLGTWPPGGFVGVDLFFPISGFLITGLIISEIERTGRLSFADFYKRRARRILPPAIVTLVAVWVIGKLLLGATMFESTKRDVLWALGFAANINFAREGVDYWHSTQPPSFVQHFWSLAVEEQFYVVWPLLVVVVFYLALSRTAIDPILAVAACAGIVFSVSLGISIHETIVDPKAAWFSTLGRGWELAAGAVTVLLVRRGWRPQAKVALVASLLGLAGIVAAASTVDTGDPFPGLRAVPVILATCVVLWSGTGVAGVANNVVLMNPLIRYIGRISYSLYLWHWVAIRTAETLLPHKTPMTWAAILLANAALGVAGHHFIEVRFQPRSRQPRRALPMGLTALWLAGAACAALIISSGTVLNRPNLAPTSAAVSAPTVLPTPEVTEPPRTDAELQADETGLLQRQISAALAAQTWPSFDPAAQYKATNKNLQRTCPLTKAVPRQGMCAWGNPSAPKVAYVVGDSSSFAYMPMFQRMLDFAGSQWRVRFIGRWGCLFAETSLRDPYQTATGDKRLCSDRRRQAVQAIKRDRPDMVIYTNEFWTGAWAEQWFHRVPSTQLWRTSVDKYVKQFAKYTPTVAFLASPPMGAEVNLCYTTLSHPWDCMTSINAERRQAVAAERAVAERYDGRFIDSEPWFCVSSLCPAFVGSELTKADLTHITGGYARAIAPAATQRFRQLGLFETDASSQPDSTSSSSSEGTQTALLQNNIRAALDDKTWPAVDVDDADRLYFQNLTGTCSLGVTLPKTTMCTGGSPSAQKVAYVIGDSTAFSYMPMINRIADTTGSRWRVRFVGQSGCLFADLPPVIRAQEKKRASPICPSRRSQAIEAIKRDRPDLVIFTGEFWTRAWAPQWIGDAPRPDAWQKAVQSYVARFAPYTGRVVFLASPPVGKDIKTCRTKLSTPSDCVSRITDERRGFVAAERAAAAHHRGRFIDSEPWFCVAGSCPAYVGTEPTKVDLTHVSYGYSRQIAQAASESFRKQGVFN